MRGNAWWMIFALTICLSVACSNDSTSIDELSGNIAIATVNNEAVTLDHYKAELKGHKKKFRVHSTEDITQEEFTWLKNRALEQVIQNVLFRQEAKKNNIDVSQEELNEELLKVESGYPEDSFVKQLGFQGLSRDEWENGIKLNLLINKLIRNLVNSKVSVSDDEMKRYFESNASKFHKKEQVRALHIMVETEEEIREIKKELQSKQKDFSTLAKEYSLGPEGASGGDLGYFEAGQMPEEFDNVFKLKVKGISEIIRTPYGFHLFKVVDKVKERKMSFDESKSQIDRILLQEVQDKAFQKWLAQLKQNSVIEIKYDLLEKIY